MFTVIKITIAGKVGSGKGVIRGIITRALEAEDYTVSKHPIVIGETESIEVLVQTEQTRDNPKEKRKR